MDFSDYVSLVAFLLSFQLYVHFRSSYIYIYKDIADLSYSYFFCFGFVLIILVSGLL